MALRSSDRCPLCGHALYHHDRNHSKACGHNACDHNHARCRVCHYQQARRWLSEHPALPAVQRDAVLADARRYRFG